MPSIRNLALIKRFTDYFKLKSNDFLDNEAGRMLVPVVNIPVPANIKLISDIALNNSDKTITVPSGRQWDVHWIIATFVTTATAGNRTITLRIKDENGNILWLTQAVNVQVASVTERYHFQKGETLPKETNAAQHFVPLPTDMMLPSGFQIQILDSADVDAAADDLTIRIMVEERDLTDE